MSTAADTTYIHDLAIDTYRRLKAVEELPIAKQHMLHMIFAAERASGGILGDDDEEKVLKHVEAAAQFCERNRIPSIEAYVSEARRVAHAVRKRTSRGNTHLQ